MFSMLGYMFYIFAGVDLLASLLGYDITGSYWSVVIFCAIAAGFQSNAVEKFEESKLGLRKKSFSSMQKDFFKRVKSKEIAAVAVLISSLISLSLLYRMFFGNGYSFSQLDYFNWIFLALIARENWRIAKENYLPVVLSIFSILINLYSIT